MRSAPRSHDVAAESAVHRVALYQYRLPLTNGHFREGLIVQNGEQFGDIAPLPGFSREPLAEARLEAIALLSCLGSVKPTFPSVRFGFNCACRTLPRAVRVQTAALEKYRPGFQSLKLKLGALSLDDAIAKIRSTPDGVRLRLDFNRKWSLAELLALIPHLDTGRIEYFEEPARTWEELLEFAERTKLPLALDESLSEHASLKLPKLKALVVKPMVLGEVPKAPEGVELILSSAYESGIGVLHLAALSHAHTIQGFDSYSAFASDLLRQRPRITEGLLLWDGPLELEVACLTQIA